MCLTFFSKRVGNPNATSLQSHNITNGTPITFRILFKDIKPTVHTIVINVTRQNSMPIIYTWLKDEKTIFSNL